ncbi:MAG: 1,4-dihydroxy-2-naphthoate octaprenyltransferase [Dehalococcoidales bacterium]|nr:1,4-dihydroxy-2-naphthoate octaprenyltransferase [Dehalococcoidales bacterium]
MNKLHIWIRASRPFTLPGAIAPVLAGTALAFSEGKGNFWFFLLVLISSLLVQIATNLVDEYADHARPEGKRKLLAPYKVIALGLLSPTAVKRGAMVCFGIATAIGIYLIVHSGWPILVICLASIAVAYFYSAGTIPLGKMGLGQPLVFVFMGPVMVMGSYFVQTKSFTIDSLWLSIPMGCTVTAILAANDLRDFEEDQAGGKRTPVTTFGRNFGRWEWAILVIAAFLAVIVMAAVKILPLTSLLSLAALPLAIVAFRLVRSGRERPQLAPALPATARFHGLFGALLALGIFLALCKSL